MSGWLPGSLTVPWALWTSMGLRLFFMFLCYSLGSEGMCSPRLWSILLGAPVKSCLSQWMLKTMECRGGAVHPRVDLFFFMLLHSLSQLWLFSLVSKPGLELANQREDGLNCWGSFTLATTSSSAQLSLCNIHREPQLPEPWKGWSLFVFAGPGGEQLRAALHQLCQWAPAVVLLPDCHCPGGGKWSSVEFTPP